MVRTHFFDPKQHKTQTEDGNRALPGSDLNRAAPFESLKGFAAENLKKLHLFE